MTGRRTKLQKFGAGNRVGDVLSDVLETVTAEGLRPQSVSYNLTAVATGRHFTTWLATLGLTLDDLKEVADTDEHGWPVMSDAVIAAFMHHRTTVSTATAKSLRTSVCSLVVWLRTQRWSAVRVASNSSGGQNVRRLIDHQRCGDTPVERHARPVLLDDLRHLIATIDSGVCGWEPFVVQAVRTWILTAWSCSLRGGEAICTLTWGMVHLDEPALHLPGGRVFKWQNEACTLPIPHNGNEPALCPVRQLTAWKQQCQHLSIPTGDNDHVFPPVSISDKQPEKSPPGLEHGNPANAAPVFAETAILDAAQFASHTATLKVYMQYKHRWCQLVEAAGFNPEHQWQTTGSHGLRRGSAQTAIANGVPTEIVSQRLRHTNIAATSVYLDRNLPDSRPLFDGITPHTSIRPELAAMPTNVPQATQRLHCEMEHDGVMCARPLKLRGRVVSPAGILYVCPAHYVRHRRSATGDMLTKPIT